VYGGVEVKPIIHSVTNTSTSLSVHWTGQNVWSTDHMDANGTAHTLVLFDYLNIFCTSLDAHKVLVVQPEEWRPL